MWTDAAGNSHSRAESGARIVSLVPSITELLFDLGLGASIVARTGFCVHPRREVAAVPKVGGTKDVRIVTVRALRPTHVIVNVDENTVETVDKISAFVPHVIVTHPNAPDDNAALYALLGGIFGAEERAQQLSAKLAGALAECRAKSWPAERVLYLVWRDPWMTIAADTYIARTLGLVGWTVPQPAGGWSGAARYPTVDDLDRALGEVDRVLLSTEPYMFRQRHVDDLRRTTTRPVDLIDAEMVSWYGSRAVPGIAYLQKFRSERLPGVPPTRA